MGASKEKRILGILKATSRSQSGVLMERDQSGEGVWRLKSVLWTCSRRPMRNLLQDGPMVKLVAPLLVRLVR